MSEYKCQEPGCHFHIGIAGDLVTDEDYEAQDYYDQEVEEHYQMHEENRRNKAARMEAAQSRSQLEERDKACRVCGDLFEPNPKSFWSAAQARILRLDDVMTGAEYLALIHRSCTLPVAMRAAKHPLLQKMIEENRSRALEVATETEPNAIPRDVAGSAVHRVPELRQQQRVGVDVVSVGLVELDLRVAMNIESHRDMAASDGERDHPVVLSDPLSDADVKGQSRGRMQRSSHVSVDRDVHIQISLSVDDAPDGAGVGTSESTERGRTPTSSETEMPPAVAAAEGDETKIQNGK